MTTFQIVMLVSAAVVLLAYFKRRSDRVNVED
jgi:hypothetical protein